MGQAIALRPATTCVTGVVAQSTAAAELLLRGCHTRATLLLFAGYSGVRGGIGECRCGESAYAFV
jgi:hypothetical protein